MTDRRLAAVMVTDMVGFTALMGADQDNALNLLNRGHTILKTIISSHQGEWLEDAGDRSLSAFPSAINAVECALEIQAALINEPELKLRIGLDVGDILISEGHAYGDTVNIASFIERLADPEGLVITESVHDALHGHIDLNVIDLGEKILKNIGHSVRLYALTGAKKRSRTENLMSALMARRVPHITGAYLAAGWILIEVTEWLATHGILDRRWIYAFFAGLLALIPSVILVTYSHGAHGRDRFTRSEKIGVPLNLLFAALLVTFLYQSVDLPEAGDPVDAASVAVLPFINLSDDESNEYFSRGLSEELINTLAKIPGLYVASRTSSFIFDSHDEDPRDIARKLRVATILEGSVRKQDNRVRITAQLIDGQNNYHLWTETYDRELANIFQIQEDIARAVAMELVGVLLPNVVSTFAEARAATLNAFDFYLRGLSYLRQPATENSLANAHDLFQRALSEDRNYAQAYAALCEVSLEQYILLKSPSLIDAAESNCQRALRLDDNMREVRFALGVLYRNTGDFEESARIFRELLDDQPTTPVWVGLGKTNVAQGNLDAAEFAFQTAIDREPGNWHNRMAMAEFLYWRGRFEDALEAFRRVIELTPDNARAYLLMAATMNYLGNTEASLRPLLKSIELSPNRGAYRDLGLTYTDLGEYEKAAEAFRRAVKLGPDDHWSWGSLAKIYSFLEGQEDASRAAYIKAAELASAVLERNERDWLTLARLAMYNVMSGVVEDGVKRITIAVDEGSHLSEVHYLDAAIHSQLGRQEQALDALERAIKLGSPVQMIARDPQFADLRDDDRFKSLIDER